MTQGGRADGVPRRSMSFGEDVAFLKAHGETIVLTGPSGGLVAVSPRYQGRVMTSALCEKCPSLGWINRSFIEAGKTGTPFDNYGGEDRFWLGPEGGQFGLYFPRGKPFTFDAWQTPHALQEGAWGVTAHDKDRVVMRRSMKLTNWSGTELFVDVERTVRVLGKADIAKTFGAGFMNMSDLWEHLSFVAFETTNKIVNSGKNAWTRETGLPSIWILSMFPPAPDTRVLVPFRTDVPRGTPIVNDRYFGKLPSERLKIHEGEGWLSFKCDGDLRGKIGLRPERARPGLAAISVEAGVLTVVEYDGPKEGAPYVNSMWEAQTEPYAGDVINAYNDGPPAPGKPSLGGFYELETSSPGAELAPGGELAHTQRTFHFAEARGGVQLEGLAAFLVLGKHPSSRLPDDHGASSTR